MRSGRPLSSRGVLGGMEDRELLGPGVGARLGTPVSRSGRSAAAGQEVAGLTGERPEVVGRAEAGHARHTLVAGGQVEGEHPAEPEAHDEAGEPRGPRSRPRTSGRQASPAAEKSPVDSPAPRSAAVTTRQPDSRVPFGFRCEIDHEQRSDCGNSAYAKAAQHRQEDPGGETRSLRDSAKTEGERDKTAEEDRAKEAARDSGICRFFRDLHRVGFLRTEQTKGCSIH